MKWSVLSPSFWQTFNTFPLSRGRTFGATQILLKLTLCTNKMYEWSTRPSCQTTNCKAAQVLLLAQGMCGSEQDRVGAWEPCGEEERWAGRLHLYFPGEQTPKKPCLTGKLLVKLKVRLEKVKCKSTGRILECAWMNETKYLCLRNGLANYTVMIKNKKKVFSLQQQLFTRSGRELVLCFWYLESIEEMLR